MKKCFAVLNRTRSAVFLMLVALSGYSPTLYAQTSGLPGPALSSAQAAAMFSALTGCATAGYVFSPQTGTCVAQTGGMVYPGAGVPVSTGSAWGTSLTAPASALVGLTDTQTLTNKSIASTEITGLPTFPSGTILGTTDTQTLTNKSIAGSEINSGSIGPGVQASSETVTFSATPTFSANTQYSTITLTAAITSFTLAAGTAGQTKTLTFCENATGGFTVAAPTNVHGFMNITATATASKCNSQHFSYDTVQTAWLADGPGVLNE